MFRLANLKHGNSRMNDKNLYSAIIRNAERRSKATHRILIIF